MRVFTTMIAFALASVTTTSWSQEPPRPHPGGSVDIQEMNVYVCPEHPHVQATWAGRCPMCGAPLQKRPRPFSKPSQPMSMDKMMKQSMADMPKAMKKRHGLMMNTPIRIYDPEVLLGSARALNLTERQIHDLRIIAMTARRGAAAALNAKQRQMLRPLAVGKGVPLTMADMRRTMMQKTSSHNDMMGAPKAGGGADRMKPMQDETPMAPTPTRVMKKRQDPPGTTATSQDPPQDRSLGRFNDPRDLREVMFGDDRDSTRDQMRDRYRDEYRDSLRDRYRDQFRDEYRDRLHDQYGDEFNDTVPHAWPYYGEGDYYRDYTPFDDEGFGNGQAFEGDDGFGDQDFGGQAFDGSGFEGGDEDGGGGDRD